MKEAPRFPEDYDGLISLPEQCAFDPGPLECKASEERDCLTAPQVGDRASDLFRCRQSVTALEQCVEHGKPPDRLDAAQATNGTSAAPRPLCPCPQIAMYRGSGNKDDAASYACGPVPNP